VVFIRLKIELTGRPKPFLLISDRAVIHSIIKNTVTKSVTFENIFMFTLNLGNI
jgi:hypothetical protein